MTFEELQQENDRLREALAAAEGRAKACESRYRRIVEVSQEGIWTIDAEARTTYANPRMAEMLGYTSREMQGRSLFDFMDDDARPEADLKLARRRRGLVETHDFRFRRKDGSPLWATLAAGPILDEQGQYVGSLAMVRDVTESKRAEDALRDNEARLRDLFDNVPVGMFQSTPEGRILHVNPAYVAVFGYDSAEELIETVNRESVAAVLYAEPAKHPEFVSEVEQAGGNWRLFSNRYRRKDGQVFEGILTFCERRDPITGEPRLYGFVQDITERKRVEEALRESEGRYRTLFAVEPDALVLVDQETLRLVEVNDAALRMFGHTREELPSLTMLDLSAEPEATRASIRSVAPGGVEYVPLRYERRRDGSVFPVEITARVFTYQARQVIFAAIRDITERKRAEEERAQLLRQVEAERTLWRTTVERLPNPLTIADAQGRATYLNPAYWALIGRKIPKGLPLEEHPEYFQIYHRDGTPFAARDLPLQRAALYGEESRDVEIVHVTADGRKRDTLFNAAPLRDAEQRIVGAVAVGRDVTEQRQVEAEREGLLAELQEANAAKDQFLAVLSHELRNPLSPILAGVAVLRRRLPPDPRSERTLAVVERNVQLQARLIEDLLDLSRVSRGKISLQRATIPLETVAQSALNTVQTEAERADLTLKGDLPPGLWVLGDPDRLEQVVLNLLSNAIKFTPAGGQVSVRLERIAGKGRVIVEDTGIGIDRALLSHLFEMFRQGEVGGRRQPGLGIGLALVKSLTELHGGRVWAESDGPGKGSRFTVELPLVAAPGSKAVPPRAARRPGEIKLLLVEDNADTRSMLQESLELMGYMVRAAASAEDALPLLQQERPDALVIDIGLPGMDGYDFLRQARRMPGLEDVPAFAATGYGEEADVRRAQEAGFDGHLVKPVDLSALDQRIREYLDARPPVSSTLPSQAVS